MERDVLIQRVVVVGFVAIAVWVGVGAFATVGSHRAAIVTDKNIGLFTEDRWDDALMQLRWNVSTETNISRTAGTCKGVLPTELVFGVRDEDSVMAPCGDENILNVFEVARMMRGNPVVVIPTAGIMTQESYQLTKRLSPRWVSINILANRTLLGTSMKYGNGSVYVNDSCSHNKLIVPESLYGPKVSLMAPVAVEDIEIEASQTEEDAYICQLNNRFMWRLDSNSTSLAHLDTSLMPIRDGALAGMQFIVFILTFGAISLSRGYNEYGKAYKNFMVGTETVFAWVWASVLLGGVFMTGSPTMLKANAVVTFAILPPEQAVQLMDIMIVVLSIACVLPIVSGVVLLLDGLERVHPLSSRLFRMGMYEGALVIFGVFCINSWPVFGLWWVLFAIANIFVMALISVEMLEGMLDRGMPGILELAILCTFGSFLVVSDTVYGSVPVILVLGSDISQIWGYFAIVWAMASMSSAALVLSTYREAQLRRLRKQD